MGKCYAWLTNWLARKFISKAIEPKAESSQNTSVSIVNTGDASQFQKDSQQTVTQNTHPITTSDHIADIKPNDTTGIVVCKSPIFNQIEDNQLITKFDPLILAARLKNKAIGFSRENLATGDSDSESDTSQFSPRKDDNQEAFGAPYAMRNTHEQETANSSMAPHTPVKPFKEENPSNTFIPVKPLKAEASSPVCTKPITIMVLEDTQHLYNTLCNHLRIKLGFNYKQLMDEVKSLFLNDDDKKSPYIIYKEPNNPHTFVCATDGNNGILALEELRTKYNTYPNGFILDIEMKRNNIGMDGHEFFKILRTMEQRAKVTFTPVVFSTSDPKFYDKVGNSDTNWIGPEKEDCWTRAKNKGLVPDDVSKFFNSMLDNIKINPLEEKASEVQSLKPREISNIIRRFSQDPTTIGANVSGPSKTNQTTKLLHVEILNNDQPCSSTVTARVNPLSTVVDIKVEMRSTPTSSPLIQAGEPEDTKNTPPVLAIYNRTGSNNNSSTGYNESYIKPHPPKEPQTDRNSPPRPEFKRSQFSNTNTAPIKFNLPQL